MRGVRICLRNRLCSSEMASEHRLWRSVRSRSGVPGKRFFRVGLSRDPVVPMVLSPFWVPVPVSPTSVDSSESDMSKAPYWFLVGVMGVMTCQCDVSHCVVVFSVTCRTALLSFLGSHVQGRRDLCFQFECYFKLRCCCLEGLDGRIFESLNRRYVDYSMSAT